METIDLQPKLPDDRKTTFYICVLKHYFEGEPEYQVLVTSPDDEADYKVLAEDWYAGSHEEWHKSIASRAKDALEKKGVLPKKHGNTGNQHAAVADPKTSMLTMRCTPTDKAGWVKAAARATLPDWVTKTLNEAAKKSP